MELLDEPLEMLPDPFVMVDKLNLLELEANRTKVTDSPLLTPIQPERLKVQAARREIEASPVKVPIVNDSLHVDQVKLSPLKNSAKEEPIIAEPYVEVKHTDPA